MVQTRSHDIDMLHGPLVPKIIAYALPVAASGFLQQLFNAADVAVVGRFAGSDALAAVGANTYLVSLMVNLFVGVSLGANVTTANYVGEGNEEGVRKSTHTAIALSLLCGTFLAIGGQLLARLVHRAVGTPEELLDQAMLYFRIYYAGMPAIMLYNFASAVLRSKGDTRRPLVVLIVSGVLNVLLNLLFVVGLGLDVAGVALATVLSNVVSGLALVELLRREEGAYHLSLRNLRIDRRSLGGIVRVGLPARHAAHAHAGAGVHAGGGSVLLRAAIALRGLLHHRRRRQTTGLPAHSARHVLPVGQCHQRDLLWRDARLQAFDGSCRHQHHRHLRHAHPMGAHRL